MLTLLSVLGVIIMVILIIGIIWGLITVAPWVLLIICLPVIDIVVIRLILKRRKKG